MSIDHQADLTLDGNAAGGLLRELFAIDMTEAQITCGGCGAIAAIGAVRASTARMRDSVASSPMSCL